MHGAPRDELVALRARIDNSEYRWLKLLGEFDAAVGWALEGFRTPVTWLTHHCNLSRIGASERVRVARALRHRPVLDAAFADGRLSYSKVRAASRIEPAGNDGVDQVLVDFAATHPTEDVERLVKVWKREMREERDPAKAMARFDDAGLRASTTFDGMGVIELVSAAEDHHELLELIDANVERRWQNLEGKVSAASQEQATQPFWRRRADALAELIRVGHANIDRPVDTTGADRYLLNLTATLADLSGHRCNQPVLASGEAISLDTALRYACDCSLVRHVLGPDSEPLDIGRKTRVWTRAQRRSIRRRDRNCCRFPGCANAIADAHHVRHWTKGGRTAVDNGCLLCPTHHRLVHEGKWTLTGNANGTLTFTSPYGTSFTSDPPSPMPARPQRRAA